MPCANDPGKNNYPCRNGYYLRCRGPWGWKHCLVTRVRNPELEIESNRLHFWSLNTAGRISYGYGVQWKPFHHECRKDIDCAQVLASKNILTPAIEGNTMWKKFQSESRGAKWVGPWTYNEDKLLPFQKKGNWGGHTIQGGIFRSKNAFGKHALSLLPMRIFSSMPLNLIPFVEETSIVWVLICILLFHQSQCGCFGGGVIGDRIYSPYILLIKIKLPIPYVKRQSFFMFWWDIWYMKWKKRNSKVHSGYIFWVHL